MDEGDHGTKRNKSEHLKGPVCSAALFFRDAALAACSGLSRFQSTWERGWLTSEVVFIPKFARQRRPLNLWGIPDA
jgi:hypothetical protein